MKLKPIESGMIIHCDTEEKAKQLISWAYENGFRWNGKSEEADTNWGECENSTCYKFYGDASITYGDDDYFGTGITEFSDLIIPELSAEEMLELIKEICDKSSCSNCPLNDESGCICRDNNFNPKKIIKACEQWKADHEKKKTEVEWVYKGVADTASATEIEYFDTEDDAREWCERRTIETGLNHAYCPVCRIKEV